eukprot:g6086.t1
MAALVASEGGDELFAKYFAELTLDVIEEQTFLKRAMEEPGPRYVWTGHPKVDRTLFIMDRQAEHRLRDLKSIGCQKNVPMLRGVAAKKNYGSRAGPEPFGDSFRAKYLNGAKKHPVATAPASLMDD